MICSMTGFGSGRAEASNLTVLVEIKSVNHRYIDTHIKIPGEFQGFENRIRHKISSSFKRGRFDVFVRIDFKRESFRLETNQGMIRAYTELMQRLKTEFPIQGELTMDMLAKIPGLITVSGTDLKPEEQDLIGQKLDEATDLAIAQLSAMRVVEGQSLLADIDGR